LAPSRTRAGPGAGADRRRGGTAAGVGAAASPGGGVPWQLGGRPLGWWCKTSLTVVVVVVAMITVCSCCRSRRGRHHRHRRTRRRLSCPRRNRPRPRNRCCSVRWSRSSYPYLVALP